MDNLLMDNLMKRSYDPPLSIETLQSPEWTGQQVRTDVLRLDKIHPVVSGNKWWKLKEYLQLACEGGKGPLITFGGAWSNHIAATAYAARAAGLQAIGIIRGERPHPLSDTLQSALDHGMLLEFISREEYKKKNDPAFLERLSARWPKASIIPEGGAGKPGIQGSAGILHSVNKADYSHILCAIGTGTMYWGLADAALPGQVAMGIPVLKGMDGFLQKGYGGLMDPSKLAGCRIDPHYHFGGYARKTTELLDFMNQFYRATGIPSDFVYTGKLFYAVRELIHKGFFPEGSRLLLIHSGGLQGNRSLPAGLLDF